MNNEQKYTIQGLDEYIRQGELQQRERGKAWKVAIGLQQVDGLQTSEYLLDIARKHIEGDITIEEAKELIDSYYKSADGRKSIENERTEEADKVSARITEERFFRSMLLGEQHDLRNRIMHVDWGKVEGSAVQSAKSELQSANTSKELPLKCKYCTLEEAAVLRIVQKNPTVTQKEIAAEIGKSERTVKTITVNL